MTMIKIEFPADRMDIAEAMGEALTNISKKSGVTACSPPKAIAAGENGPASLTKEQQGLSDIDLGSDDNGMFTKEETQEQENLVDPAKVDLKKVPFNAEFCGKATKPFYASGKREGQWKKRQGVDEDDYDAWYASELVKVSPAPAETTQAPINTASAFGVPTQQVMENAPPAPHDAGSLMAWIAEAQAAQRITQEQVNIAYNQEKLTLIDIFPGPDKSPEVIAERVSRIHNLLNLWANG